MTAFTSSQPGSNATSRKTAATATPRTTQSRTKPHPSHGSSHKSAMANTIGRAAAKAVG